jgi:hypothetical protein
MYNICVPVDAQLLQQWRNTTFNETGNTELHTSLSQHEPRFNVFTILYLFTAFYCIHLFTQGTADGGTVAKVLCYKSEGRWFDSRWCHWNFSLT